MHYKPKRMTTLQKLKAKVKDDHNKMPPIKEIHKMLTSYNIPHEFRSSTNVVEYRSAGKRYVNSRHNGKEGFKLIIKTPDVHIELDTSDSYYSWNSRGYADKIVNFLKSKGITK